MPVIKPLHPQSGISMVEILVALALSLILTLVVSQVYLSNQQSYRLQEAQGIIQENGRFMLELLTKDTRRVGNMGCASSSNTPLVIANPSPSMSSVSSIIGYDASTTITSYPYSSTTGSWNTPPSVNAVAGTDIFSIQFTEPCGGHLQNGSVITGTAPNPSFTLLSSNTCSISAASTELVLSDCAHTEVFRSDSNGNTIGITGTGNNTQAYFNYTHDDDAEVMLLHTYTYFIQTFNSEPTLYRIDNATTSSSAQPIIEGVEDMQLLYGVDSNSDLSVDQYFTAGNVNNWADVIAMRVDVVLRSTGVNGNSLNTAPTTACPGIITVIENSTPVTDNRLRRCYSFTINLRNPRT